MTAQQTQQAASLSIEPPQAVTANLINPEQEVQREDPVVEEAKPQLDATVDEFMADLLSVTPHSDAFNAKSKAIRDIGAKEIQNSAKASSRLVERPMRVLKKGKEGSEVANGLSDLRSKMEELDPSKQGVLSSLIAKLPGSNRLKRLLREYESADEQIQAIVDHLRNGQVELQKDNAAIDLERQRLYNDMQMLKKYIYLATRLQERLQKAAAETDNPDLATQIKEDLEFNIAQKRQDLLTQLAVSMQGYLAFGLIRKNNDELIKGVDRACTTTIAALRTAVAVSSALYQQELVLNSIGAVNALTDRMIASTGEQLRTNTAATYQQAADSGVKVETLKKAFNDIFATMDSIDTYQAQAIQAMTETANSLQVEVAKAQDYVTRSEREDKAASAADQLKL
jgi:uncharacterized protein YaaN involved in tellurite resistance